MTTTILAYQIEYRFSGGASNSLALQSIGGAKSSYRSDISTAERVFSNVTLPRGTTGLVDYRCLYVHNASPFSITWTAPRAYIWNQWEVPVPAKTELWIELALGSSGVNGIEQTIANVSTAPTGVTFYNNTLNYAGGQVMANIPPGGHHAIWVKRVINGVGHSFQTLLGYSPPFEMRVEGGRPVDVTATAPAWRAPMVNFPPEPPPGGGSLVSSGTRAFNVTDTASATQNTENVTVAMTAGQRIKCGTCNLTGATGVSGDTYIRLLDPSSVEVASNDDYIGLLSFINYTALETGNYTFVIGAYGSGSADGTAAWEIYSS